MAKKLGNDYRLFVRASDGTTFNQPGGQGNLTINRNQNFFSLGSKDTGTYDPQAPGLKTLTLALTIIPDLPDVGGWTRMEYLDGITATEIYQIRKKPFSGGDVVFECNMYTSLGNTDMNLNAPVTGNVTLSAAEAPTVDELK